MIRVTAGKFKGTKILSPTKVARPTSSMMREALFNIISNQIDGAFFLDLFSGSGIMGIEALSRGAEKVIFVEKDRKNANNIQKNLINLNITDSAQIICSDVVKALNKIDLTFDIIFADPPYALTFQLISQTFTKLKEVNILKDNADVFIETDSKFQIDEINVENFYLVKSKKYGNSALHQYRFRYNK